LFFKTPEKSFISSVSFVSCRIETLKKAVMCSLRVLKGYGEVKNMEEEWEEEDVGEEGEEEWEEEEW